MYKPFIPLEINSSLQDLTITKDVLYWYPWIAELSNKNIWLSLCQNWKSNGEYPTLPPPGYEYYIVSGDSLMYGLADKIADTTKGIAIQLSGPLIDSSFKNSSQVKYLPYTTYHQQLNGMPISSDPIKKNIQYKASALTSRVTQSKVIIFSALTSLLKEQDFVVSLHHKYDDSLLRNVHHWEMSGNDICDRHTKNFIDNWLDKKITLNNDDQNELSYNNPAYQNSALNFTQESYHYSYMTNEGKSYIEPGPFLTEKTWKCLLSKTAFIPVGQVHSYNWLTQMGMKFDYGNLDLSFDEDPGNITRLEKIVHLIDDLNQWSANELYHMTEQSCEHNYDHIMNKSFWNSCEKFNQPTIELLINL